MTKKRICPKHGTVWNWCSRCGCDICELCTNFSEGYRDVTVVVERIPAHIRRLCKGCFRAWSKMVKKFLGPRKRDDD